MATQTVNFLDQDEADRILAAFSKAPTAKRNRVLVMTMIDAGLRVSEALALTWDDVRFPAGDKRGEIVVQHGKRDKGRRVPMSDRLAEALAAHKESRPARCRLVFSTLEGGRLSRFYVNAMLRRKAIKALGEARGKEVHPHTCRHTFGNWLRQKGCDARTIADLMGHTNPSLTVRFYFSSTKDDREAAISKTFDQGKPEAAAVEGLGALTEKERTVFQALLAKVAKGGGLLSALL